MEEGELLLLYRLDPTSQSIFFSRGTCDQLAFTTDPYGSEYSDYCHGPVNFGENCIEFMLLSFQYSNLILPM